VSQIKEQLESIGDTIKEAELVMTTLNGLPRSWESFIQGICSRRRIPRFSRLWEDCTQEEVRLAAREEKLGDEENQSLTTHTRKGKRKKELHSHKKPHGLQTNQKFKKDFSSYRCFICQKMGHIAINCPNSKGKVRKGKYRKHHAHATKDDEHDHEKTKEEDSSEEYVLISAVTGTITHGSDT
jgi:hypothetical protein